MPAAGEAAAGFFAEGWPDGWCDGVSALAAGDGGGAVQGAGAGDAGPGGAGEGFAVSMAGATPLGVAAGAACANGCGALEGAGSAGGGDSTFAAMGGWLGAIGGFGVDAAGIGSMDSAGTGSAGGVAAASVGFPGAPFSSASLIATRPSNVEDLTPIIAEDLHYASLWRIQESAALVRRLRRLVRMRRMSFHAHDARRNSSEAFVPPKPNEFDKAILISFSRALCGTRSIVVATEGLSRLRVGGATFACIARIE